MACGSGRSEGSVTSHDSSQVKHRSFAGDVLRLASGTTLAQVLIVAAAPVLTRLYEPAAFGTAAQFAAVVGIAAVVACLRYDLAIVLPKTDEDGAALLWVSLALASCAGLGMWLLVEVLPDEVLTALGSDTIPDYALLVGLGTSASGLMSALSYWYSRRSRYGRLSVARVLASGTTAVGQIAYGAAVGGSAVGLVGSSLAGQGLTVAALSGQVTVIDGALLLRGLSWQRAGAGLRRYWRYPAFGTWSALMNTLSWQLPALILGAFFGSAVVGYYALGFRTLAMPMNLVGTALGQVFFQRAAAARHDGVLDSLVRRVYGLLIELGFLPFAVLSLAGGSVFELVFGSDWREAGIYTQILAMWTLVWFISSPLSFLYGVLDKQAPGLVWSAAILATRLVSLLIGGWLGDARVALALFSGSGILVYGYMDYYLLSAAGVRWRQTLPGLRRAVMLSVAACVVIGLAVLLHAGDLVVTLLSAVAIVGNTALAGVSWRRKHRRPPGDQVPT